MWSYCTVTTITQNDITSAGWQHSHSYYFGLFFEKWKEFKICQLSLTDVNRLQQYSEMG